MIELQTAHNSEHIAPPKAEVVAPPGLREVFTEVFSDLNSPVPIVIDLPQMSGENARFDPIDNVIHFPLEANKLDKLIYHALGANRTFLSEVTSAYLANYDAETEAGLRMRRERMENPSTDTSLVVVTPEKLALYEKKRQETKAQLLSIIASGSIQGFEQGQFPLSGLIESYALALREMSGEYAFGQTASEESKQLSTILASEFSQSVKDVLQQILGEYKKTLRHEISHAEFTDRIHSQRYSKETRREVEGYISASGLIRVEREFQKLFPSVLEGLTHTSLEDFEVFCSNNIRMNEIGYQMIPDHLKEAYLYRSYMVGIEEVLIPLIEIAKYGTESEADHIKKIPMSYWDQAGLLLPTADIMKRAVKAAETKEGLAEIIVELTTMMDFGKFKTFLAQRVPG